MGSSEDQINESLDRVYNLLFPWTGVEVEDESKDLKELLKEYNAT